MNETLGKLHFWITIVAFNAIFIPLFVTGVSGDHRRIYDYSHYPDLANLHGLRVVATVALVVMLVGQVLFLWNFFFSLVWGKKAEKNPWRSNTLEWTTESPPPHGNWPADALPTVYRPPYEYSHPDREEDYWPQNLPA